MKHGRHRSYECECGYDFSEHDEYDDLRDDAETNCQKIDGFEGEASSKLDCPECGRTYVVTVTASCTIDFETEIEYVDATGNQQLLFESMGLSAGMTYVLGDKAIVFDEDGNIAESWNAPTEDQLSLFADELHT